MFVAKMSQMARAQVLSAHFLHKGGCGAPPWRCGGSWCSRGAADRALPAAVRPFLPQNSAERMVWTPILSELRVQHCQVVWENKDKTLSYKYSVFLWGE